MAKKASVPVPEPMETDHPVQTDELVQAEQLYLPHGYRGHMSQEAYIPPGLYTWGDPALMGIEGYLVENGHAVRVVG